MIAPRKALIAAIASAMLLAGGGAARAQVQVDGKPEAVHLEARDVPLQEVLSALHDKFNLQYRSDDALETRKTGVFDGPLQRVAARILEGYDFAMKVTPARHRRAGAAARSTRPNRGCRRFGDGGQAANDGGRSQALRQRTYPLDA